MFWYMNYIRVVLFLKDNYSTKNENNVVWHNKYGSNIFKSNCDTTAESQEGRNGKFF